MQRECGVIVPRKFAFSSCLDLTGSSRNHQLMNYWNCDVHPKLLPLLFRDAKEGAISIRRTKSHFGPLWRQKEK